MITYAILGTNWISGAFYDASLHSDLVLSGVCSRARETGQAFTRAIGQPDMPVYTSVEDLAAAPDIQAVYIAGPNAVHAPLSEALLRGGKHVLCEKPIVTRPQELERLQALAREKNLVCMEAIMYLNAPARLAVKEALPALGGITSAHFDFSQLSSRYDELAAGDIPNVFLPGMGGGAWNDLGIYCIYPVLDFFGPPQRIQAHAQMIHADIDGAGAALLEYPNCPITLTWSKLGQSRGFSQIMGTKGTLTLQSLSQFQGITLHPRHGEPRELVSFEQNQHRLSMRHEARAFCDYIAGRPAAVAYEEACALALAVARAMEEVRRAWG